jgi:putative membrane protein
MTTASTAKAIPFRFNRLLHLWCVLFAIVFGWSAYRPVMREDWWLENGLVFLAIGILIVTHRRMVFSDLSYLLIFVYLVLHEWGAHYRYAVDPLGEWAKQLFHTLRNDYDRVVHFAFGALIAYPQREILIRKARLSYGWALWIPVVLILGYGAAYEIVEAIAAAMLSPDAGDAFLALQGDPWDTHKDMFMALGGAVVAMAITGALSARRRPNASRLSKRAEGS